MRHVVSRVATIAGTILAMLVATVLTMPPAAAEDPVVIELPVYNIPAPIVYETIYLDGELQDVSVDLPAGADGLQVDSQCVDVPGVGRSCIGTPAGVEQPPLDVTGGEELAPLVKWSDDARAALEWMIPEGIEHVRTLYKLPADDRILTYARPQLRVFMVDRIREIMDKKVYGVPLSDDEQNALSWVEQQYIARDRLLAEKAYAEYVRFKQSPCTYRAPQAPTWVEKPETMPQKVIDWCKLPSTQTSVAFEFVPPLPTPKQFTSWAAYRNPEAVGFSALEDPIARANLGRMTSAGAAVSGFAFTSGAAFTGATATALANLATIGTKLFPYASRTFFTPAAKTLIQLGARVAGQPIGATLSGLLATAIVAIVAIVFLVVTGVSIWLLIEHESVAETLRDRVDDTENETDPFGLEELNEELDGLPVNSALELENPPRYRDLAAYQDLSARVMEWTTFYNEGPPGVKGTSVADPEGVWPGSTDSEASDPTWRVSVGGEAPVERQQISVPLKGGGVSTIRFSRGWMVVTKPGVGARAGLRAVEEPQAVLEAGYVDVNGRQRILHVNPWRNGLVTSFINALDEPVSLETSELRYTNTAGELVVARLKGVAPTYLDGPRPVAVGPLFAGRPVLLRPNPVATDGSSLDEATVLADYTFDWTVEHLEPASGQWQEVAVPDGYGSKFVPTEPGEYDARVTLTSIEDPTSQQFGSVRFTVTAPPVDAPVAALVDNGSDRLELDLQLQEEVPGDDLTVEVTWPGDIGSATNPVQTLAQDCIQTGPIECTTPRTGLADLLVFPVTPQTDLRRPVKVVATNSTGGAFQAEFLLGEGRPTIAPPPAGLNDAEPGTTLVAESSVQVSMPLPSEPQIQDYLAAQLVPSPGGGQDFGLVDPETGNTTGALLIPTLNQGVVEVYQDPGSGDWFLAVRGLPDLTDIGSLEIPVVVAQTNGTRQLVMVDVHVHASTEDRFRGALQHDIDPTDFAVDAPPEVYPMVLGGRVDDPAYRAEMCVSLEYKGFPQAPRVRCGPMADFVDAQGVAEPFPYAELFPAGMTSGPYRAEAWLNTPGDRVDTEQLGVSFLLTQDSTYPRPSVALGTVSVAGKARVGRRLTAEVDFVDPAGATLRYQWLRDGQKVAGATSPRYRLARADRGDRFSVKVTATFPDWKKDTRTSARTPRVR
jgi:hypothetical protein